MKKLDVFERVTNLFLLVLVVCVGAWLLERAVSQYGGKASDWAAWVQALGSIAAILGAYILGEREYRRARDERLKELREQRVSAINRFMAAIDLACNRVGHLQICLEGDPPEIVPENLADVDRCTGTVKDATNTLAINPALWIAGNQVAQAICRVHEASLRAVATDPCDPNLFDDAIRQCSNMLRSSEKLIERCKEML
ncbi:MAG: hypothetical protein E2576_14495 [Alcaligenaceae bacterium]|nr:hypothetical protein [Alcaligenaceae bacterium SAGV5]MPS50410.1 hypothetical protein [Alcaligenaceae bacterium SAGV3]MPT57929.1 hypothetical protein [Alcaligenaceae bacterium]